MKRHGALHLVALQQRLAPHHFLENFAGKIFSFEEQTQLRFVESRVVEQRQKHVRRRMVQQCGKLFARR